MNNRSRRAFIVAGGLSALLVGGGIVGGSALAGPFKPGESGPGTAQRQEQFSNFIDRLSSNLGVDKDKLKNALIKTRQDLVDEAVKAGRLTQQQGDAIKQRIKESGGAGPFGGPRHGPHGGPDLGFRQATFTAAADYLGMTQDQLHEALRGGKSLAQITSDKGKDLGTLKSKMQSAFESQLNDAVKSGKITSQQSDQMKQNFQQHLDQMVNRVHGHDGRGPRKGPGASMDMRPGQEGLRGMGFGHEGQRGMGPGREGPLGMRPGHQFRG